MIDKKKTIFNSIRSVLSMVPASINAVMPFNKPDPWWIIRDVISVPFLIIVPQICVFFGIDYFDKFFMFFTKTDNIAFSAFYVFIYCLFSTIQFEFMTRYIIWTDQEKDILRSNAYVEEELKLD